MGLLTLLTRTWLTRSPKPFRFLNEADEHLPYADLEGLGLYVHIPFCKSPCSFCPYCKTVYRGELADRYLDALLEEIRLVGRQSVEKKRVTSLYFGGGTPALVADRLGEIIGALREYFEITDGIGVELHPDNVTPSVLRTLADAGVTRISIGIQSFSERSLGMLGRSAPDLAAVRAALSEVRFETVSMDLIFALPGQTLDELILDMETAFASGANHVAVYPFIDFAFTDSTLGAMPKRERRALLDGITRHAAARGYVRTSIWTFANAEGARYSSMTRDNFLGFGCSATTLLRDSFKINTFSVEEYCRRIGEGKLPTSLTLRFTRRQRMVYYLFWTAYSTRVDPRDFRRFFGVSLGRMYGLEIALARLLGLVRKKNGIYEMTPAGAFYYHYYEGFYTLAYIDKMWGIMRQDAFPEEIKL